MAHSTHWPWTHTSPASLQFSSFSHFGYFGGQAVKAVTVSVANKAHEILLWFGFFFMCFGTPLRCLSRVV
jgi:hypothetical protein